MLLFDTFHKLCHILVLIEDLSNTVIHALTLIRFHSWLVVRRLHAIFEAVVTEVQHETIPLFTRCLSFKYIKRHLHSIIRYLDLTFCKSRLPTVFHISTLLKIINLMLQLYNQICIDSFWLKQGK